MKVAFSSTNSTDIDAHFGQCPFFTIYEIKDDNYSLLEIRKVDVESLNEMDRIETRVNLIKDCKLVFLTQIGPTAAAKVTNSKIMPVKVSEDTTIFEQMERLVNMLKTKPPIWLAKAMANS
ncbi:nitrogen fixation protein NifX [Anaerobacillus alkalidiazotrophicus]|uniref:Nitrogen fixation protein NifX n=1 Tax=Anaerobacillus alkalidiazotrophicus TaxID=472963 RepID=A0A1S2M8Z6_9BACI|nr:nitrogen fixation protein NifX [Anaerobacillus alkalidiazotrophicus]OIJ21252.1 nitrogen fixation protein NifX [Anaerobacillus alkalidiazotrophicus]